MDGLLTFDDGKLAITADGKLVLSLDGPGEVGHDCCPLAIVVWNSNSAKDDDFDITLNGATLGSIDNSTNTCTGRIFATDTDITAANLAVGAGFGGVCLFPCNGGANFEPTLPLDSSLFVSGANTLRVQSTNNANNGNFGSVLVARLLHTDVYAISKAYVSGSYNFLNSGPPTFPGQDFTFDYP